MSTENAPFDWTYPSYLRLKELLELQQPLSPHPDEMQFIILHQAFELWFKLTIYELKRVLAALEDGNTNLATRLMRRVNAILHLLCQQVQILETIAPQDFHRFREYSGSSNGLQSYQFREIEVISGLRHRPYLEFIKKLHQDKEWLLIATHLTQLSLREAWEKLLNQKCIHHEVVLYSSPNDHYDEYLLAETLCDYDELFLRFRFLHLQLVERLIGGRVVRTGEFGQSYLRETLKYRFFPQLWEVRNVLTESSMHEST